MTPAQWLIAVDFAVTLEGLIQSQFEQFRKKGELTPELEAKYQEHQAQVYARPSAQPEPEHVQPAPAPDVG